MKCKHCHWPIRYDSANVRWFMDSDVRCPHPDGHQPPFNTDYMCRSCGVPVLYRCDHEQSCEHYVSPFHFGPSLN